MISGHEKFVKLLEDEKFHKQHKKRYDNYPVSGVARFFGGIVVGMTNLLYGEKPTLQKLKAIEIIARIPYQSWELMSYWLMNFFFHNQKKSIHLTKAADFGRLGQDNETMHVIVITEICDQEGAGNWFWHAFIPIVAAHLYFAFSSVLFLINKKFSYEMNYLFESHAYSQYDRFLQPALKEKPLVSEYMTYYGRVCKNQYEFFRSVRNDELIHRDNSVIEIQEL